MFRAEVAEKNEIRIFRPKHFFKNFTAVQMAKDKRANREA
jgi:hypothetical protein